MLSFYFPMSPSEKIGFDTLWDAAIRQNQSLPGASTSHLTGISAVAFFQTSGLPIPILKQIWALSCPTASMDRNQFYTALRYIAMVQKGDSNISRENLERTKLVDYGLPVFVNSSNNNGTKEVVTDANYAISPADHNKYYALFLQYDEDKDGLLTHDEANILFVKSGLDELILQSVWKLSDVDQDDNLNAKEFCVAFHLIVCIGKRKLACPSILPVSLQNFLEKAPKVPLNAPVPTNSNVVGNVSSKPIEPKKVQNSNYNNIDSTELNDTINSVRNVLKETAKLSEIQADSSSQQLIPLKEILQNLQADKISLTASIESSRKQLDESKDSLNQVISDIAELTSDLSQLRLELESVSNQNVAIKDQIANKMTERTKLILQIEEVRESLQQTTQDIGLRHEQKALVENELHSISTAHKSADVTLLSLKADIEVSSEIVQELSSLYLSLVDNKERNDSIIRELEQQVQDSKASLEQEKKLLQQKEMNISKLTNEKVAINQSVASLIGRVSKVLHSEKTIKADSISSNEPDNVSVNVNEDSLLNSNEGESSFSVKSNEEITEKDSDVNNKDVFNEVQPVIGLESSEKIIDKDCNLQYSEVQEVPKSEFSRSSFNEDSSEGNNEIESTEFQYANSSNDSNITQSQEGIVSENVDPFDKSIEESDDAFNQVSEDPFSSGNVVFDDPFADNSDKNTLALNEDDPFNTTNVTFAEFEMSGGVDPFQSTESNPFDTNFDAFKDENDTFKDGASPFDNW